MEAPRISCRNPFARRLVSPFASPILNWLRYFCASCWDTFFFPKGGDKVEMKAPTAQEPDAPQAKAGEKDVEEPAEPAEGEEPADRGTS